MYLVFTCMPGESYCWQHWVLLLYMCDVFQAPIISLGGWCNRNCHLSHQACVLLLRHIFNLTFSLPTNLCSVFQKEFHRQVVSMMVCICWWKVTLHSIFKLIFLCVCVILPSHELHSRLSVLGTRYWNCTAALNQCFFFFSSSVNWARHQSVCTHWWTVMTCLWRSRQLYQMITWYGTSPASTSTASSPFSSTASSPSSSLSSWTRTGCWR